MRSILTALAAAAALGFAATAPAQTPEAAPAATAVATPETQPAPAAEALPEAAPESAAEPAPAAAAEPKSKIYFFRPSRLTGAVYTYRVAKVGEDGRVQDADPRIGRLPNGSYFVYEAEPGIYNFNITGPMAVNLAQDRLRMEVESGETYYVEQSVRMGLVTGGFRLVPSTQADFERRKLKEAAPIAADDD